MVGGFDLSALAGAVAARGAVVRVVVAAVSGSTPREPGAAMLVWPGGQSGTIGGGALELEATRVARVLLGRDTPWARTVLRQPLGPGLGQCCGGHVTLFAERFAAYEITSLADADAAAFVRPLADSQPPRTGDMAAARLRRAARSSEGLVAGLVGDQMVEPMAEALLPLWLYGAGHVGRAIVNVATDLPIAITWIDTGRDRFPDEMPPHATPLLAAHPGRVAGRAPDDCVHLVLTYSHALDLDICDAVLRRPFRHLGLIGSASKRARFLSRLRALGHSEAALARLTCPIGDRSLGKRPAAIALGVVSDLLRLEVGAARSVLPA